MSSSKEEPDWAKNGLAWLEKHLETMFYYDEEIDRVWWQRIDGIWYKVTKENGEIVSMTELPWEDVEE